MLPPCYRKWQLIYYGKKTLWHSLEFKTYMIWLSLNQNIMHQHLTVLENVLKNSIASCANCSIEMF